MVGEVTVVLEPQAITASPPPRLVTQAVAVAVLIAPTPLRPVVVVPTVVGRAALISRASRTEAVVFRTLGAVAVAQEKGRSQQKQGSPLLRTVAITTTQH